MRVISYELARITFLFPFEEFVPLGGVDAAAVVAAMGTRYGFARLPDLTVPRAEIEKNGLKFETGKIAFEGSQVNVQALSVYPDGVNIDANTSERADAFLSDLIDFLKTNFGFREFTGTPRKFYGSQLVVEFDKPLSNLISGYDRITSAINSAVAPMYGGDSPPFGLARIDLQIDPAAKGAPNPNPRFIIERRSNIPFGQERYYCAAPLQTREHIQILEDIERRLG